MKEQVLSILVENTTGVLSRISGLFSRRGFNINSITAGVTSDVRYTRITIVTNGDEQVLEQIENQVAKLEDVVSVERMGEHTSVARELVLVKIKANDTTRPDICSLVEIFRANVVDVFQESMTIELTGGYNKITAFLKLVNKYGIIELARTGVTALTRGSVDAEDVSDFYYEED
ncbi:MAG: acetolactate synthase small subunit [Eubacterium sp.]|nr:acetolactate synthase small subunit [Eubacterium sp.]